MCRWGCTTTNTTYMCKWCGTRYCRECLRGDFVGHMQESTKCRMCNQRRCQGARVEYVVPPKPSPEEKGKGRGRSASPSKSAKSAPKSAKKTTGKKSATKKKGKKKKK